MKMKLHHILLGSAVVVSMAACVSEDISTKVEEGSLSVAVETLAPLKTRAELFTVTNFPVTIFEADGTTRVSSYESVSAMPASILLPTGEYVLEAHTPGAIEPVMTAPYYLGRETSTISKGLTTETTIICKMINTSVKVNYDDDFLALFTSWTITFDDGNNQALGFANTDGNSPAAKYWYLGDNVERLTVNFRGTNRDGTVTASMILTKSQATESYDGATTNFTGGDAVVVNFTPTDATDGFVTVNITASIFGTDAVEVPVTVNVVDNGTFTPEDPNNPNDPPTPPAADVITLSLPAPLTFTMGEGATLDKSLGNTHIEAEKGIKSLMVTAESSNPDMVASLEAVGAGYGLDFVSAGVEVVENNDLVSFFNGLGQTLSVPTEGDLTYDFPIGNFFSLLDVMSGTHQFHLTVTDMEGNTKSGTVVITVNE